MHYIRFLKAPQISTPDISNKDRHLLSAKITITSDLGESFLSADLTLVLSIRDRYGREVHRSRAHWISGFRELKISIDHLSQRDAGLEGRGFKLPYRLSVWPAAGDLTPYDLEEVLRINRLQNVRSADGAVLRGLSATFRPKVEKIPAVIYRNFKLDNGTEMMIQEDTGESIARHIWCVHFSGSHAPHSPISYV